MDCLRRFNASTSSAALALMLTAFLGAPSSAQVTPADRPAAPGDVTVEDSAILPSAGNDGDTAAPSMALDCQSDPASCKNPLTEPSEGPALSIPSGDPTDPIAGAPVVAQPKD